MKRRLALREMLIGEQEDNVREPRWYHLCPSPVWRAMTLMGDCQYMFARQLVPFLPFC